MKINSKIDSNAVALDARNFGTLPNPLSKEWMAHFVSVRIPMIPPPTKAIIEIANTCNLDCPMCRVGQYGINLSRTMPLSEFHGILNRLPHLKRVRLNGLGESTLLPNFEKYVDELKRRNIFVEIISNGTGDLNKYEHLINAKGAIYISWDAADPILFERLRRPAKWANCLKTLAYLAETAKTKTDTSITLLFTLQRSNVGQLSPLVELAAKLRVSRILVNVVKVDNNQWLTDDFQNIRDDFENASELALKTAINLVMPGQVAGNHLDINATNLTCGECCEMPWKEVLIRWNGDVQVCNMFNPYLYGNIHLNDFLDIWNNSFAQLFRSMLNTQKSHPYCANCVYIPIGYENEDSTK